MAFQNTTTVCASLSNFINLLWQLKTSITKSKPQKITYRSYKNFDSARFNEEFKYVLSKENIISCAKFYQILLQKLNKHPPLVNYSRHITYHLSHHIYFEIFKRSNPTSKIYISKNAQTTLMKNKK